MQTMRSGQHCYTNMRDDAAKLTRLRRSISRG
jgi:hypothetical protein